MAYDFDFIVIGAGSGGIAASRRASLHGAKVAIIEGSRVGGTCVIRGCVPKKLMMYAGQYGDMLREAQGYGWAVDGARFEMARWAEAKATEIDRLEAAYRDMLSKGRIQLIEGRARIDGPHTVRVGEHRITAERLLLANGASPVRDSVPGIDACATSDELLDLTSLPDRAIVLGSGYIAMEFASILARLGAKVQLVFRAPLPLRGFEDDLRTRLAAALSMSGIELLAGHVARRVESTGGGFRVHLEDGRRLEAPFVLNATGRRPNTKELGLETVGIAPDASGAVPVDATLRTSSDHIWAIGDVTNRLNLTPVAIAEGRAVADALFGPTHHFPNLDLVAAAVFTLPPIGTIGPTETEARESGAPVEVFEADFRPMRQTFFNGAERSYMKVLVDAASDRVLAVHMLGADAPEIVQSLAVALTAGATKTHFDRTMPVHPTAAEEFMLMRTPARVLNAGD